MALSTQNFSSAFKGALEQADEHKCFYCNERYNTKEKRPVLSCVVASIHDDNGGNTTQNDADKNCKSGCHSMCAMCYQAGIHHSQAKMTRNGLFCIQCVNESGRKARGSDAVCVRPQAAIGRPATRLVENKLAVGSMEIFQSMRTAEANLDEQAREADRNAPGTGATTVRQVEATSRREAAVAVATATATAAAAADRDVPGTAAAAEEAHVAAAAAAAEEARVAEAAAEASRLESERQREVAARAAEKAAAEAEKLLFEAEREAERVRLAKQDQQARAALVSAEKTKAAAAKEKADAKKARADAKKAEEDAKKAEEAAAAKEKAAQERLERANVRGIVGGNVRDGIDPNAEKSDGAKAMETGRKNAVGHFDELASLCGLTAQDKGKAKNWGVSHLAKVMPLIKESVEGYKRLREEGSTGALLAEIEDLKRQKQDVVAKYENEKQEKKNEKARRKTAVECLIKVAPDQFTVEHLTRLDLPAPHHMRPAGEMVTVAVVWPDDN